MKTYWGGICTKTNNSDRESTLFFRIPIPIASSILIYRSSIANALNGGGVWIETNMRLAEVREQQFLTGFTNLYYASW